MKTAVKDIVNQLRESGLNRLDGKCRTMVAEIMEEEDRVLYDDEVIDVVDSVVEDEPIYLEDNIEGEDIYLTEDEIDDIKDEVYVDDDEDFLVYEGKRYALHRIQRNDAMRIAQRILDTIHVSVQDNNIAVHTSGDVIDAPACACPECGSYNCTTVWVDNDVYTVLCNDCGDEFEARIEEQVDDMNVTDYDIIKCDDVTIFGSIGYDFESQCYIWQVYENGEVIDSGTSPDEDAIIKRFNSIAREWEDIAVEDIFVAKDSGLSFKISSVRGNDVYKGYKKASRTRIAIAKLDGKLIPDTSNRYSAKVMVDDIYSDNHGTTYQVFAMHDDGILFYKSGLDENGIYHSMPMKLSYHDFMEDIDSKHLELQV